MLWQVSAHFYYKQYAELNLVLLKGLTPASDHVPAPGPLTAVPATAAVGEGGLPGGREMPCASPGAAAGSRRQGEHHSSSSSPRGGWPSAGERGSESLTLRGAGPRGSAGKTSPIRGRGPEGRALPAAEARPRRGCESARPRAPHPRPPASAPRPRAATRTRRPVRKMEAKARGAPPCAQKAFVPFPVGGREAQQPAQPRRPGESAGHRGPGRAGGDCRGRRLPTREFPTPAPGSTYRASDASDAPSRPAAVPAAPAAPYGSPAAEVQVQTAALAREPQRRGRGRGPDTPFAPLPPPEHGQSQPAVQRTGQFASRSCRKSPPLVTYWRMGGRIFFGLLASLPPSRAFRALGSRSLVPSPWGRARARRLAARRRDAAGALPPRAGRAPSLHSFNSFILLGAHCCLRGAPLAGFRWAVNASVVSLGSQALLAWGQRKRRLHILSSPGGTHF